jgi:hypothetical protein
MSKHAPVAQVALTDVMGMIYVRRHIGLHELWMDQRPGMEVHGFDGHDADSEWIRIRHPQEFAADGFSCERWQRHNNTHDPNRQFPSLMWSLYLSDGMTGQKSASSGI